MGNALPLRDLQPYSAVTCAYTSGPAPSRRDQRFQLVLAISLLSSRFKSYKIKETDRILKYEWETRRCFTRTVYGSFCLERRVLRMLFTTFIGLRPRIRNGTWCFWSNMGIIPNIEYAAACARRTGLSIGLTLERGTGHLIIPSQLYFFLHNVIANEQKWIRSIKNLSNWEYRALMSKLFYDLAPEIVQSFLCIN